MLDAINTIAGGVRRRRRRVIGGAADPVTAVAGAPPGGSPFNFLYPYNPDPETPAWVATGTLGYYIHRGRVYLQGGVGCFNGYDPMSTGGGTIITQLPPEARPKVDVWELCSVDPATTQPPFASPAGAKWVWFATDRDDGVVKVVPGHGQMEDDGDLGWMQFFGSVLLHDVSWPVNEQPDPGPASTVVLEPLVPTGFQTPSSMAPPEAPPDTGRIGKDGNRVHYQGVIDVVAPGATRSGNLWGAVPIELRPGALTMQGTGTILEIPVLVDGNGHWMFYIFSDGLCAYRQRFSPNVPFYAFTDQRLYYGSFSRGGGEGGALSGDLNRLAQTNGPPLSTPDVPGGAIGYQLWDQIVFPKADDPDAVPQIPADYPYGLTDLAAPRVGIFFAWTGDGRTNEIAAETASYYKLVYVRETDVDGVALIAVDMRPGAPARYRLIGTYIRGSGYGRPFYCALRDVEAVVDPTDDTGQRRRLKFSIGHPSTAAEIRYMTDPDAEFSGFKLGGWAGRAGIIESPDTGTDSHVEHRDIRIIDPSEVLWSPGHKAHLDGHGYFALGREPQLGNVTTDVGAGGIVRDGPYLVDAQRGPLRNW